MAVTTCTVSQILFEMASQTGELHGSMITALNGTDPRCGGLTTSTDDTYNGGIARLMGGTTIVTINDYIGSLREFTMSASLSAAAGNFLEWCWFDGLKRVQAFESIRKAIRQARPWWYEEVIADRSSATLTFASTTHAYTLPTAVNALFEVGVQPTSNDAIDWIEPEEIDEKTGKKRVNWRVEGQDGAYTLRFMRGHARGASVPQEQSTKKICLHYGTWEPDVTTGADTTQLPLSYFWVASEMYATWLLANGSPKDLQNLNVHLPQIQRQAELERQKLQIGKLPQSWLLAQSQVSAAPADAKKDKNA